MKRSIRQRGWWSGLVAALVVLGVTAAAWAQNTFPTSGNVGIGTTSPGARLDTRARTLGGYAEVARFATASYPDGRVSLGANSGEGELRVYDSGDTVKIQLSTNANSYINHGNVGIGTTTPTKKLDVVGDINVTGNINAKYQDIAEWVPAKSALPPGTVVVIDPQEHNRVLPAAQPYDTRVAGVVSARPGLLLGEAGEDKAKVAHSGRITVKADAQYGPIAVGDLLVTSPTPGHAMRSTPVELAGTALHRPGTLLGKALEPLAEGQGEILVLLTLQ